MWHIFRSIWDKMVTEGVDRNGMVDRGVEWHSLKFDAKGI